MLLRKDIPGFQDSTPIFQPSAELIKQRLDQVGGAPESVGNENKEEVGRTGVLLDFYIFGLFHNIFGIVGVLFSQELHSSGCFKGVPKSMPDKKCNV